MKEIADNLAAYQKSQRNEAAERLRAEMQEGFDVSGRTALLDEALAAERRATVERIRAHCKRLLVNRHDEVLLEDVMFVLDEEAAR